MGVASKMKSSWSSQSSRKAQPVLFTALHCPMYLVGSYAPSATRLARRKSFLSAYFKNEQMQTHQGTKWLPRWVLASTVIPDLGTSMPNWSARTCVVQFTARWGPKWDPSSPQPSRALACARVGARATGPQLWERLAVPNYLAAFVARELYKAGAGDVPRVLVCCGSLPLG